MTIVEATFVFPIMLIIVFLMMMLGEVYYQRSRVEFLVSQASVTAAARCENPMMGYLGSNEGKLPTRPDQADVAPYRYILHSRAKDITSQLQRELDTALRSMKPLFFRGMNPKIKDLSVTPKLNVLVSSIETRCEYEIRFPIRMIFSKDPYISHYNVTVISSVGDPAEFVRNVNTVQDLLERVKVSDDVKEVFNKIKNGMDKIRNFIS